MFISSVLQEGRIRGRALAQFRAADGTEDICRCGSLIPREALGRVAALRPHLRVDLVLLGDTISSWNPADFYLGRLDPLFPARLHTGALEFF